MFGKMIGFGNEIALFNDAGIRRMEVNIKARSSGFAQSGNKLLDTIIGIPAMSRARNHKQCGLKAFLFGSPYEHGNEIIHPHSQKGFEQAAGTRDKQRRASRFQWRDDEI